MNHMDTSLGNRLDQIRRYALYAGAAGLIVWLLASAILGMRVALGAYLIGFLYVLGLSLGALAILMLQHLTGGHGDG